MLAVFASGHLRTVNTENICIWQLVTRSMLSAYFRYFSTVYLLCLVLCNNNIIDCKTLSLRDLCDALCHLKSC